LKAEVIMKYRLPAAALAVPVFLLMAAAALLAGCDEERKARPIAGLSHGLPVQGAPATAQVFAGEVVAHPFMAAPGRAAMHGDGASSDVHAFPSPLGVNTQVHSRSGSRFFGGACATVTFDRDGNLVALCTSGIKLRLVLLSPRTLDLLAIFPLPGRPSTFAALVNRDVEKIMSDTSGGAYFYLDNEDRVVLADSQQKIRRIGHRKNTGGNWEFYQDAVWDLGAQVPHDCLDWDNWFPSGECDPVTAVMPDHNGLLWWVTRKGRVGTLNTAVDAGGGIVRVMALKDEEIQNGFSVAEDGVYVVSDHAMYGLQAKPDGTPVVLWREIYDRGSKRKVGSINQGSGTTPTLLGSDYVSITDNADDRINLLVYKRRASLMSKRLACKVPLFDSHASATDNSTIGFNRSLIAENNAGYHNALTQKDWSKPHGGITRIDIREDASGCDVVWQSDERSPSTVAKMSSQTSLAYYYTFEQQMDKQGKQQIQWYFTAIDANSGETRFKVATGVGRDFDNNWAPIALGPDGTAYVGVFGGLVAVYDAAPQL
jgi:hypothetical protein